MTPSTAVSTTSSASAAAAAAAVGPDDLDAQIHAAEQAILRRNRRLAQATTHLEHRLAATAVQGVAVTAVAGAVALGAHAWLSRREPAPRRRGRGDHWGWHRDARTHDEPIASKGTTAAATLGVAALLSAVPWHRLMPMLWPRLPASVRRHMSGETAGLWASIVVPMLLRVRRQRRR